MRTETASTSSTTMSAGALGREALRPVLETPDDEGRPEDEQDVGHDRADERSLDDADEPRPQREDADEELGEVAERGLHDAGHPGAEAVPEPVDAPPHDGGEDPEGRCRHDEGHDAARVHVVGDARRGCEDGAATSSRTSLRDSLRRTAASSVPCRPARLACRSGPTRVVR